MSSGLHGSKADSQSPPQTRKSAFPTSLPADSHAHGSLGTTNKITHSLGRYSTGLDQRLQAREPALQ